MNSHKYFTIVGKVVYRSNPVPLNTNKFVKSGFFAVKVVISERMSDGTYKNIEDYFTIHTYKEKIMYAIREGYIVKCHIMRTSNLWLDKDTKKPKIKQEFKWNPETNKKDIFIGNNVFVFESYYLMGDQIEILDDSVNQEEIDRHNSEFEHVDAPYNSNNETDTLYNDIPEDELPEPNEDDSPF